MRMEANDEKSINNNSSNSDSGVEADPKDDPKIASGEDNNVERNEAVKEADNGKEKEKALFKMPAIVPRFSVSKTSSKQFMEAEKLKETPKSGDCKSEEKSDKESKETKPVDPAPKIKKPVLSAAEQLKLLESPIPYKEPEWGGPSDNKYSFEIVKNGLVINTLDLSTKSFYVFGRLPSCDVPMEHPSLSRHHTVIQYCKKKTDTMEEGWYLYDLDSTHGTWVNKFKVKPRIYSRLRVGHVVKLGGSSRLHILQGPPDDVEEESELSVTELKQQRERQKNEAEVLKVAYLADQAAKKEVMKPKTDDGCSWGIDADDAIEINQSNPFAVLEPQDESLYIDDPKKALKGFFEREGLDLPEYKVETAEKGHYLCTVELPIDAPNGQPIIAEATVSGKKRDAVLACALEACRILDRQGELRKSHHESRKRKPKDWADNDFYDSDDDTFLDRTGDIEKKRMMRLKKAKTNKQTARSYNELKTELDEVEARIDEIQKQLDNAKSKADKREDGDGSGIDALDAFMDSIKKGGMDTKTKMALKKEMFELRTEQQKLIKLVNIAKPPNLPPLPSVTNLRTGQQSQKALPLFGKMRGPSKPEASKPARTALPPPSLPTKPNRDDRDVEEEEEEEDEEEEEETKSKDTSVKDKVENTKVEAEKTSVETMDTTESNKDTKIDKITKEEEKSDTKPLPSSIQARIQRLLGPTKTTDTSSEKTKLESPVKKLPESNPSTSHSKTKMPDEDKQEAMEVEEEEEEELEFEPEKRTKSKRKPRIRKPKVPAATMQESYDATDPKYATWLPPKNQSGDGKTSLNEKYGY